MMQPELSRRLTAAKHTRYIVQKGIKWWHNFIAQAEQYKRWDDLPEHLKKEVLAAEKQAADDLIPSSGETTKTYYVFFEINENGRNSKHWAITETKHDLDTVSGLSAWIEKRSQEFEGSVFLHNWKELKRD